jgi:hypothetical protein
MANTQAVQNYQVIDSPQSSHQQKVREMSHETRGRKSCQNMPAPKDYSKHPDFVPSASHGQQRLYSQPRFTTGVLNDQP